MKPQITKSISEDLGFNFDSDELLEIHGRMRSTNISEKFNLGSKNLSNLPRFSERTTWFKCIRSILL